MARDGHGSPCCGTVMLGCWETEEDAVVGRNGGSSVLVLATFRRGVAHSSDPCHPLGLFAS
jgi:hypothetical protein